MGAATEPGHVYPRSDWTDYTPALGGAIPLPGTWVQHHTAGGNVTPEDRYEDTDGPAVPHLGILGVYAFPPGWATKAKLLRRYRKPHAARGGKHAGRMVPGIARWAQMEVRRAGDGRYVVVQIDPARQRQVKLQRAAQRRERLANILRVRALERATMRSYERYHLSLGWRAIGYTVVVFASGRAYAGRATVRGGRITAAYHGAHCPGYNHRPGISWSLDAAKHKITRRMRASTVAILRAGGCANLIGHREAPYPTTCPVVSSDYLDALARDVGAGRRGVK